MNEREHLDNPAQPEAWGDVQMPETAEEREREMQRAGLPMPVASAPAPEHEAPDPGVAPAPTLREDVNAYGFGETTLTPRIGPGYTHRPLGPGNEAIEGGESPAPRSYAGGAMGKYVAGLSPSFPAAAEGEPPPGGPAIYTPAEAQTTFRPGSGIARPIAARGTGLSPYEDVPGRAGDSASWPPGTPEQPERPA